MHVYACLLLCLKHCTLAIAPRHAGGAYSVRARILTPKLSRDPLHQLARLQQQLPLYMFLRCAAAGAAQPLRRAPNWLRRPAAATFGFGGKLVAVSNARRAQQGGEAYDSRLVTISQAGTLNKPSHGEECQIDAR